MIELMNTLGINSVELLAGIWTAVLLPVLTWIGKEIHAWACAKKVDKYTDMLVAATTNAVKDVYQTVVADYKGTEEWTDEKKEEVLELAKTKILFSLSSDGYKILQAANADFDEWMKSLIESKLYDLKHQLTA